jgi:hypothetical protein
LGHDLGVFQNLAEPIGISLPVDHRELHGCLLSARLYPLSQNNTPYGATIHNLTR